MLEAEGYEVDTYFDSRPKWLAEKAAGPAILDIKMPHGWWHWSYTQRLLYPSYSDYKDDELDEALGLGMGADDLLPSPFPSGYC